MIFKVLKKDFLRNKVTTITVWIFLMLSAILVASGTNMIVNLNNSLDYLFQESSAPHFVQYHSGDIDQIRIDEWSQANDLVKHQQTSEMVNIDGSKIYLKSDTESEVDSVMDMGFVKQNHLFDYLLDLDNKKISVQTGEIAVPIFLMQKNKLSIGDTVIIKNQNTELEFRITDFVRDVQMNPSIISSKRFVVSDTDFEILKNGFGDIEYGIGFQLNNIKDISEFSQMYSSSDLPHKGTAIDYGLLITLNSITDGLVAAVIILISLFLNVIALLCLRFIILSTIETDYREIGVMKAVGIRPADIKKIYLSKYIMMALSATLVGFIISIFINKLFSKNILLYIGTAPKTPLLIILPFIAALIVFALVIGFCMILLRRFDKISAVEAFRMGTVGGSYKSTKTLALHKRLHINPNIIIGLRDVILRMKSYILLFFVFIICTFIIIVPMNFLNTIQSPEFVEYMGMEKSDILIDLRQSESIEQRYNEMVDYIKNDPEVEKYATFITCQYEMINKDGYNERIDIKTGDFTIFPLDYLEGVPPVLDNEIALSYLNANELEKQVGDIIPLIINNQQTDMIVSGIYQDITNGGKTAKANIEPNQETLWYNINVDVNKDVKEKIDEYHALFEDGKTHDIKGYFQQTFGNTIEQLKLATLSAIVIASMVAVLITALFLKMLIAKDLSQIAIMRSIGISLKNIQLQYLTRAIAILTTSIILGTIISNTVGQSMLSIILSMMGASHIEFVINPIQAYVLIPIALIAIVTITTLVSLVSIKKLSISDINAE